MMQAPGASGGYDRCEDTGKFPSTREGGCKRYDPCDLSPLVMEVVGGDPGRLLFGWCGLYAVSGAYSRRLPPALWAASSVEIERAVRLSLAYEKLAYDRGFDVSPLILSPILSSPCLPAFLNMMDLARDHGLDYLNFLIAQVSMWDGDAATWLNPVWIHDSDAVERYVTYVRRCHIGGKSSRGSCIADAIDSMACKIREDFQMVMDILKSVGQVTFPRYVEVMMSVRHELSPFTVCSHLFYRRLVSTGMLGNEDVVMFRNTMGMLRRSDMSRRIKNIVTEEADRHGITSWLHRDIWGF